MPKRKPLPATAAAAEKPKKPPYNERGARAVLMLETAILGLVNPKVRADEVFEEILEDLGGRGQTTAQERHILKRACTMIVVAEQLEAAFHAGNPKFPISAYLMVSEGLRRALAELGLKRRGQALDLHAYMEERLRLGQQSQ